MNKTKRFVQKTIKIGLILSGPRTAIKSLSKKTIKLGKLTMRTICRPAMHDLTDIRLEKPLAT